MNNGLGFSELTKAPFFRRDTSDTGFDVAKQPTAGRNEKTQKILKDALGLVVGQDPKAHSWQNGLERRMENSTSDDGISRNILISRLPQAIPKYTYP